MKTTNLVWGNKLEVSIFRIAIIQVSTIRITRKNLFMRDWSLDHSILSINKLLREIPFKNYEWMKNYE